MWQLACYTVITDSRSNATPNELALIYVALCSDENKLGPDQSKLVKPPLAMQALIVNLKRRLINEPSHTNSPLLPRPADNTSIRDRCQIDLWSEIKGVTMTRSGRKIEPRL